MERLPYFKDYVKKNLLFVALVVLQQYQAQMILLTTSKILPYMAGFYVIFVSRGRSLTTSLANSFSIFWSKQILLYG
jgi:hypothetical protein